MVEDQGYQYWMAIFKVALSFDHADGGSTWKHYKEKTQ